MGATSTAPMRALPWCRDGSGSMGGRTRHAAINGWQRDECQQSVGVAPILFGFKWWPASTGQKAESEKGSERIPGLDETSGI